MGVLAGKIELAHPTGLAPAPVGRRWRDPRSGARRLEPIEFSVYRVRAELVEARIPPEDGDIHTNSRTHERDATRGLFVGDRRVCVGVGPG
jgi:hypothetical protein